MDVHYSTNSRSDNNISMSEKLDTENQTGSGEVHREDKTFNPRYLQHVGKELYLFDSVFNGTTYIHIRELYRDNARPTRNGITLTLQRCNELYSILPEVVIHIDQIRRSEPTFYRRHLGGNWFVTMETGYNTLDIRKFWRPDNETSIRATRKGVSLTFNQFEELKNGLQILDTFVPELNLVIPCYLSSQHLRDLCKECSPNNNKNNIIE